MAKRPARAPARRGGAGRPRPGRRAPAVPRVVVCVAGMPGSGKEGIVGVAETLGFAVVRMGDVVRDEAARRGLPITDAAVGGMAHQERVERGFGIWAERTLPRLRGDRILIDGLRGKAELEVFRRAFGDRLVVVGVHASPATRFRRMASRGRADDAASLAALRSRDDRELGWGLGDVIATADVLIVNEGDAEGLRRSARAALEEIAG